MFMNIYRAAISQTFKAYSRQWWRP